MGNTDLGELLGFVNGSKQDSFEAKLKQWAQPPGLTERNKCELAERMVEKAIKSDEKLSKLDITVFAKGSYANRTNIPSDSDVDIAICAASYYLNTYPEGLCDKDFNFVPSGYFYEEFKKDVASAIVNYFGNDGVTVGNKAIQIHANTVRVDADAVPHMVHRRYKADGTYYEGVALKTSDGKTIYNWPDQDYKNAVAKNERSGKRYKAAVRILKNLRCEMKDAGISSANCAASYLLACLAWNIPDYFFDEESYVKMMHDCLTYLQERTSDLNNVKSWVEVNEMKYLFGDHQGWKFDEVHDFLTDALEYFRKMKK